MDLPVMPPVRPMLAKLTRQLPEAPGMVYEPKWDGFRCIVFRDREEVELGSRTTKPLGRYFPELVGALREGLPPRCVVDGEIVVVTDRGLDFDALQNRLHPAASRVAMLAEATPASLVAFDVLADGDDDLRGRPFADRRRRLEELLGGVAPPLHVTPATRDPRVARDWFSRFEGAGLDGVVAKPGEGTYQPDKRVMLKVKHQRTADCVVAGFRWHKSGGVVGSLLLGLFDAAGELRHVGVTASFTEARRRELVEELAPLREGALEGHPWGEWASAGSGGAAARPRPGNRWNAGKDMSWEPLRAEWVVEVAYDHLQGDRFRHSPTFVRWRPDRDPSSCTYDQLEVAVPAELAEVFAPPP